MTTRLTRFVSFNEGVRLLGVSRTEAYRRQKTDPTFPRIIKPLGRGTRPSALDCDEIAEYQARRLRERDEAVA